MRIESYGRDVMVNIILDVMNANWLEEFKKHLLLKELLWKHDAPRGVKGDNSGVIFSVKAKACWQNNERKGVKERTGIIIEHAVPRLEIYTALSNLSKQNKLSRESIKEILDRMMVRVAIIKEEDDKLNKEGLRQKMPKEWDGNDPLARHRVAKIKHDNKWQPDKYKQSL